MPWSKASTAATEDATSVGYAAAPVSQGLLDTTERTPASRLSTEALERFKGEYTPYAGGFSSGRSAPPAELVSAIVPGGGTVGKADADADDADDAAAATVEGDAAAVEHTEATDVAGNS